MEKYVIKVGYNDDDDDDDFLEGTMMMILNFEEFVVCKSGS